MKLWAMVAAMILAWYYHKSNKALLSRGKDCERRYKKFFLKATKQSNKK